MRREYVTDSRDATHNTPRGPAAHVYFGGEATRGPQQRLQHHTLSVGAEVARHLRAVDATGPCFGDVEEIAQAIANGPVNEPSMLERVHQRPVGRGPS